MSQPLNPNLYAQLKRVFGKIRISNAGQKMVARYVLNRLRGYEELLIEHPGEYYQMCCDKCNDTRFRFYVNHVWGHRDEKGRKNLWLAICYNENCYAKAEDREELLDRLSEIAGVLEEGRIMPGEEPSTEATTVDLPGPVFELQTLPSNHPANRYLAGRFYEPERLGRYYHVGYCPQSHYYLAKNRIIIPVYAQGALKGWQARLIGEVDRCDKEAPPKYWNDPRMDKSKLLYNVDNAVNYRTGVVMEGPSKVWALGPMGMGTFGSMSRFQERIFVSAFRKYSGVMMPDPDVFKDKKKEKLIEQFERIRGEFAGGLALIEPPDDPGKLDRKYLREFITREAERQGVHVSWETRKTLEPVQ